jgi:hypothetical protein
MESQRVEIGVDAAFGIDGRAFLALVAIPDAEPMAELLVAEKPRGGVNPRASTA